MKYYTIQNNSILIAENEQALTRFYDNVLSLPNDYEEGKYIAEQGELVLNPYWEEEQQQKTKEKRLEEIKTELDALDLKRIRAVCEGGNNPDTGELWLDYYNNKIIKLREELTSLVS